MASNFDLSNRVILISGASSGLGAGFARRLIAAGAKVVIGARRVDRLQALAKELGENAFPVEMDVVEEASVQSAFDAAEAHFGLVDSVVVNAGISSNGMGTDMDMKVFDQAIAVNLRGAFLTAREGAKRLITAGQANGRIVFISSITAIEPSPGLSAYAGSKAAVSQMGKSLAREWFNRGINVNMILPGYIKTEINQDWFETEAGKKQISKFNRRRLMPQSGLDDMLLFLCSDESEYITGTEFVLDDGQIL